MTHELSYTCVEAFLDGSASASFSRKAVLGAVRTKIRTKPGQSPDTFSIVIFHEALLQP
jgi:hypothetical protein